MMKNSQKARLYKEKLFKFKHFLKNLWKMCKHVTYSQDAAHKEGQENGLT